MSTWLTHAFKIKNKRSMLLKSLFHGNNRASQIRATICRFLYLDILRPGETLEFRKQVLKSVFRDSVLKCIFKPHVS